MAEPAASQGDFSLQLAQWLLDQFNSHEALNTVSNQLATVITQAQQGSRAKLNAHIGRLIFNKANQNSIDDPAGLCTRLCHSLLLDDLERDSRLSSGGVHEHVFQFCVDSLVAINSTKNDNLQDISVRATSVLVSELYDSGLISVAQVYGYLKNLTTSPTPVEDQLLGLCGILQAHGPALKIEPWKIEMGAIIQWVKNAVQKFPADGHIKAQVEAATILWSRDQRQRPNAELGHGAGGQDPLGSVAPQSQILFGAFPSYERPNPAHDNKPSMAEHTSLDPPSIPSISKSEMKHPPLRSPEDDTKAWGSLRGHTRACEPADSAESVVDDEPPSGNNYGHRPSVHDDESQDSESTGPISSPLSAGARSKNDGARLTRKSGLGGTVPLDPYQGLPYHLPPQQPSPIQSGPQEWGEYSHPYTSRSRLSFMQTDPLPISSSGHFPSLSWGLAGCKPADSPALDWSGVVAGMRDEAAQWEEWEVRELEAQERAEREARQARQARQARLVEVRQLRAAMEAKDKEEKEKAERKAKEEAERKANEEGEWMTVGAKPTRRRR